MRKQSSIAQIAIFFAIMLVLHLLSSIIFNLLPVPIKPTIIHIPVIIASIIYGPRIGAILGALMGIISVVTNTVVLLPTSYLFSPFVDKWMKNKPGLVLAGAVGSMTNTIFVLGGIFILFSSVYNGDIRAMLALIFSANAISEMIISAILTVAIVPALEKLKK